MQSLVERWQAEADTRSDFLNCYQMMTSNMLAAIEAGEFNDPGWVNNLLSHFAYYYFNALDAYEQAQPETPQVWRLTFDSARQRDTLALQNLLLGVNAHINFDLIFTLRDVLSPDWQQLTQDERQGRYADHCHVNQVIGSTVDAVQDQVLEPGMPVMDLVDKLLGPFDEMLISRLIAGWRETVWENAIHLLQTQEPDERARILHHVEEEALKMGRLIG